MKKLPAFFCATLLASATVLRLAAQEPATSFGILPGRPNSLLPEGQTSALPLMPDSIPPLEDVREDAKKEKKSATTAADDALRDRIKLRQAKTKAQSDPELQAIFDSSFHARTDFEQRAIMKRYYTLLCARIAKIDKTISKDVIEAMKNGYLGSYDQTRIAPTVPPVAARSR